MSCVENRLVNTQVEYHANCSHLSHCLQLLVCMLERTQIHMTLLYLYVSSLSEESVHLVCEVWTPYMLQQGSVVNITLGKTLLWKKSVS